MSNPANTVEVKKMTQAMCKSEFPNATWTPKGLKFPLAAPILEVQRATLNSGRNVYYEENTKMQKLKPNNLGNGNVGYINGVYYPWQISGNDRQLVASSFAAPVRQQVTTKSMIYIIKDDSTAEVHHTSMLDKILPHTALTMVGAPNGRSVHVRLSKLFSKTAIGKMSYESEPLSPTEKESFNILMFLSGRHSTDQEVLNKVAKGASIAFNGNLNECIPLMDPGHLCRVEKSGVIDKKSEMSMTYFCHRLVTSAIYLSMSRPSETRKDQRPLFVPGRCIAYIAFFIECFPDLQDEIKALYLRMVRPDVVKRTVKFEELSSEIADYLLILKDLCTSNFFPGVLHVESAVERPRITQPLYGIPFVIAPFTPAGFLASHSALRQSSNRSGEDDVVRVADSVLKVASKAHLNPNTNVVSYMGLRLFSTTVEVDFPSISLGTAITTLIAVKRLSTATTSASMTQVAATLGVGTILTMSQLRNIYNQALSEDKKSWREDVRFVFGKRCLRPTGSPPGTTVFARWLCESTNEASTTKSVHVYPEFDIVASLMVAVVHLIESLPEPQKECVAPGVFKKHSDFLKTASIGAHDPDVFTEMIKAFEAIAKVLPSPPNTTSDFDKNYDIPLSKIPPQGGTINEAGGPPGVPHTALLWPLCVKNPTTYLEVAYHFIAQVISTFSLRDGLSTLSALSARFDLFSGGVGMNVAGVINAMVSQHVVFLSKAKPSKNKPAGVSTDIIRYCNLDWSGPLPVDCQNYIELVGGHQIHMIRVLTGEYQVSTGLQAAGSKISEGAVNQFAVTCFRLTAESNSIMPLAGNIRTKLNVVESEIDADHLHLTVRPIMFRFRSASYLCGLNPEVTKMRMAGLDSAAGTADILAAIAFKTAGTGDLAMVSTDPDTLDTTNLDVPSAYIAFIRAATGDQEDKAFADEPLAQKVLGSNYAKMCAAWERGRCMGASIPDHKMGFVSTINCAQFGSGAYNSLAKLYPVDKYIAARSFFTGTKLMNTHYARFVSYLTGGPVATIFYDCAQLARPNVAQPSALFQYIKDAIEKKETDRLMAAYVSANTNALFEAICKFKVNSTDVHLLATHYPRWFVRGKGGKLDWTNGRMKALYDAYVPTTEDWFKSVNVAVAQPSIESYFKDKDTFAADHLFTSDSLLRVSFDTLTVKPTLRATGSPIVIVTNTQALTSQPFMCDTGVPYKKRLELHNECVALMNYKPVVGHGFVKADNRFYSIPTDKNKVAYRQVRSTGKVRKGSDDEDEEDD